MTHACQIARTCAAQRQTGEDTFQIADLTQRRLQFSIQILQCAYGLLTIIQYLDVTSRHMQPALKHAAAHGRDAVIEDRREGVFSAAGQALGQLEITPGSGVHDDAVLLTLHGDTTDMRQ